MLPMQRLATLAAALLLSAALALPAAAGLTAEDQQEVRDYQLTTEYLSQVEAVTRDALTDGVRASLDPEDFRQAEDLDALAETLDGKPGVHDLLAEHGLTAREYLVGALALFGAALVVRHEEKTGEAPQADKVNPQQVAFYKEHRERIESLMARPPEQQQQQ